MAIKNIWGKESTQFFQEMRKTKFHASKNCGLQPTIIFLNFKIYAWGGGGNFTNPPPPPNKNRIKMTSSYHTVQDATLQNIFRKQSWEFVRQEKIVKKILFCVYS